MGEPSGSRSYVFFVYPHSRPPSMWMMPGDMVVAGTDREGRSRMARRQTIRLGSGLFPIQAADPLRSVPWGRLSSRTRMDVRKNRCGFLTSSSHCPLHGMTAFVSNSIHPASGNAIIFVLSAKYFRFSNRLESWQPIRNPSWRMAPLR